MPVWHVKKLKQQFYFQIHCHWLHWIARDKANKVQVQTLPHPDQEGLHLEPSRQVFASLSTRLPMSTFVCPTRRHHSLYGLGILGHNSLRSALLSSAVPTSPQLLSSTWHLLFFLRSMHYPWPPDVWGVAIHSDTNGGAFPVRCNLQRAEWIETQTVWAAKQLCTPVMTSSLPGTDNDCI